MLLMLKIVICFMFILCFKLRFPRRQVDEKTRTLEEAAEAFERSENEGKFTGKKDEMRTRRMSNVSRDSRRGSMFMAGSRRDSVASIKSAKSVPGSPLVSRNTPPSPLVEGDKEP